MKRTLPLFLLVGALAGVAFLLLSLFGLRVLLADAVDQVEFLEGARTTPGHVAQAGIAEDDVGGDALPVSEIPPQVTECLEECFVFIADGAGG